MNQSRQGFHKDDGAYYAYAKGVEGIGDELHSGAGGYQTTAGGYSTVGEESGFTAAVSSRLQGIKDRFNSHAEGYSGMGESGRATEDTYTANEEEHARSITSAGGGLD